MGKFGAIIMACCVELGICFEGLRNTKKYLKITSPSRIQTRYLQNI
jgi:hypothetical protein